MARPLYWFNSTSWFWSLPFKWSAGVFCTKGFSPHFQMERYPCPTCPEPHPMDPISVVALCTQTPHLQQGCINSWPELFRRLVSHWWHNKCNIKHKRNFIRALLPMPLYNFLSDHVQLPKRTFHTQLHLALKERRDSITTPVKTAKQWLIDHHRCLPLPAPVNGNLWNMAGSPMGTSSAERNKRKPQYHQRDPLPQKVAKEPAMTTSQWSKSQCTKKPSMSTKHPSLSSIPQPYFSPNSLRFFQLKPQPEPPPYPWTHSMGLYISELTETTERTKEHCDC